MFVKKKFMFVKKNNEFIKFFFLQFVSAYQDVLQFQKAVKLQVISI